MLVNIREFTEKVIEADSIADAVQKWNDGKIELTPEDFKGVEITEYIDK